MELGKIIKQHEFKTFYKNGNKLIKIMDEKYPQSDVLNEALNQTRAQELGLPVPKVLEVCKIENKWAIISDYIEGKTLSQVMKDQPERTVELMKKFVEIQLLILSKVSIKYPGQPSKIHYAIDNSNLSAMQRFNLHSKTSNIQKYHNVCHGDFVPSNIMVTDDGKFYILDWSHATQGNPFFDICVTYVQLKDRMEREDLASLYIKYITEATPFTEDEILKAIPLTQIIIASRTPQIEINDDFVEKLFNEGGR